MSGHAQPGVLPQACTELPTLHISSYLLATVLLYPSDLHADPVETAEQHLEASSSRDTSGLIW